MSLRLRFRSQSTYARVKAQFNNPSGGVIIIKQEGVTHTREKSGAAHPEVVLTGKVPEKAALSTYECRSVEGLTGETAVLLPDALTAAWRTAARPPGANRAPHS